MPTARKLLQCHLEAELFDRLTEWQHANGFKTTTAAVRELLVRGMAAKPKRRRTPDVLEDKRKR